MPDITPGPVARELEDFPVGAIIYWGSDVIPVGWLLCNGQSITATSHPALYEVFPYGFIPDLRSRVVVGIGDTYGLGAEGGAETVTLTPSQIGIPGHAHTYDDAYNKSGNLANTGSNDNALKDFTTTTRTSGDPEGGQANASSAHNNMQPFITINYIVKAFV